MKTILAFAAVVGLAIGVFADIQDPPGNDYGPTRKLGRGISNFVIAPTEFFTTVNQSTKRKVIPPELAMAFGRERDAQPRATWPALLRS